MLQRLTVLALGLHLLALGASGQAAGVDPGTIESSRFDELITQPQTIEDVSQIKVLSQTLWDKYRKTIQEDPARQKELSGKSITYKDKVMKFSLSKKGEKPAEGYPLFIALHGGGSAPASLNDSQWEAMKSYYLGSVITGIYVATRGVTNTWNLHFVDESYPLYDRLIEDLIAFEGVDPNRVYIMGFSAGGDGVYQIAPRMADRWAAANMSAGHHNWITFDNLYRLPFLLQVGQNDSAYNRNKVAVENSNELGRLQGLRGGYVHEVYVHQNGSHNSWRDNDASRRPQPVLANPEAWLKGEASGAKSINSNAIDWLNQYKRDARPSTIYWDPNVGANERIVNGGTAYLQDDAAKAVLSKPNRLFYWLDLGAPVGDLPKGVIHAAYHADANSVEVQLPAGLNYVRVLLDSTMLDLAQPIRVAINETDLGAVTVQPDLRTMTRTLLERGDANYIFTSEIVLVSKDGIWSVAP